MSSYTVLTQNVYFTWFTFLQCSLDSCLIFVIFIHQIFQLNDFAPALPKYCMHSPVYVAYSMVVVYLGRSHYTVVSRKFCSLYYVILNGATKRCQSFVSHFVPVLNLYNSEYNTYSTISRLLTPIISLYHMAAISMAYSILIMSFFSFLNL